jgi:hypothetical protein
MATALREVVVQGVWAYSVSCAYADEVACGHKGHCSLLGPEEGRGSSIASAERSGKGQLIRAFYGSSSPAGGETMSADMLATIRLEGYSAAQCSEPSGACAADIRLESVGITGAGSTRCIAGTSSVGAACQVEWRCDGCNIPGTTGKLKATFGVAGTYAYKMLWNVTSTSAFGPGTGNSGGYDKFQYIEDNPGQNSSLAGWVLPEIACFRRTTIDCHF